MVLIALEIVFNKPHPSILLHIADATIRKVLILFLQEIKRDITVSAQKIAPALKFWRFFTFL